MIYWNDALTNCAVQPGLPCHFLELVCTSEWFHVRSLKILKVNDVHNNHSCNYFYNSRGLHRWDHTTPLIYVKQLMLAMVFLLYVEISVVIINLTAHPCAI